MGKEQNLEEGLGGCPGGQHSPLSWPIVVDLDGTLTPTDTLVESLVLLMKREPLLLLRLPLWLTKGRAAFKEYVSTRVAMAVEHMPFRTALVEYLRSERAKGRRVVLATAADQKIATAVAEHTGLFHDIIASDGVRNLKGTKKLEAIRERVPGDFVYVGDNHADLPIWQAARAGILVGVSPGLARAVRRVTTVVGEFSSEPATIGTWLRALRVHQWLKNALIFVPLLTAFSFDQLDKLVAAGVAFLAFSLAASATYLLNDLWDLESDRAHPRKRHRPLASARIPILAGVGVAACALPVAMILAASVSPGFLTMLLLYVALTSAYSWKLKRIVLVDVVMLSLLYTLRIIAGAVAIGVTTSSWLLAFSVFTFFSLALVKRCSELVSLAQEGKEVVRGRDYGVGDLVVLWPLGVGAAMCSVVVFGLFISAPETQARYASPELLWFIAVALIYWLSRVWIKTSRGEMHDDPLVFAVRDRASGLTMFGIVLTTLVAHYVRISGA